MVDLRVIRSEAAYGAALAEYESYFDNEPKAGSAEGDRFELLGMLLTRYEEETAPITADPVETIRLVMEQRGYERRDLNAVIGSKSRASEILSHKRELTLAQIRRLHNAWNIPPEALIGRGEAYR